MVKPAPSVSASTNAAAATADTNVPSAWTGPKELPDTADEAWAKLMEANHPPNPPADWNQRQVTDEERAAFKKTVGIAAGHGADLTKEFIGRFPADPRLDKAKELRKAFLGAAVRYGNTDREKELAELGGDAAPQPGGDPAFAAKFMPLLHRVQGMLETNMVGAIREYSKGLHELQKDFPNHPQILSGFYECASLLPPAEATPLLDEVLSSKEAPEEIKMQATGLLKKLKLLGTKLDFQFTAVDGKEVDTEKLRGKVILVDFWATWCGPCVASIPAVKAAYSQYHDKGLEILGINLDEEKADLNRFVAKNEIPWAQYFDGKGWQNKFATQYSIQAIPNMWLLDKKGNLRDINARNELEDKVSKLLNEN